LRRYPDPLFEDGAPRACLVHDLDKRLLGLVVSGFEDARCKRRGLSLALTAGKSLAPPRWQQQIDIYGGRPPTKVKDDLLAWAT
jgi:hypothetical protein